MASELVEIFIDTNAFIQLRDLKDLPWRDIFPDVKQVNLIVASRVIEELDKFKNSTNNRKRDRSRLALKLIESASKGDGYSLLVRSTPIEIRIVISNAPPPDWSKMLRLDRSKPDDQLVAEAVTYGNEAVLFSYDTGPRIRARLANIKAFEPMEDWHLPKEKTDEQRKITELEENLERALASSPKIITGFDRTDESRSKIEISVPILDELDTNAVARLTAAYLAQHPPERITARQDHLHLISNRFGGYTEGDVERYERDYSAFRKNVDRYFQELNNSLYRIAHANCISYFVENDSGVSAIGLRVEVGLTGAAMLLADKHAVDGLAGSLLPPAPPQKPKSRTAWDGIPPFISPHVLRNEPRDPTRFVWFDRPDYESKKSALQCEDFRATRLWRDEIILLVVSDLPFEGIIELNISATNLSAPVDVTAAIRFAEHKADWSDEYVRRMLPSGIRTLLEQQN
ncbi:MAG TPA: PIN domain-containing protein [Pseudolabrys sp.]|nr:PIN domain-containing protein [Pseudolabrys sp.]